jgi:HEAT repeat protein
MCTREAAMLGMAVALLGLAMARHGAFGAGGSAPSLDQTAKVVTALSRFAELDRLTIDEQRAVLGEPARDVLLRVAGWRRPGREEIWRVLAQAGDARLAPVLRSVLRDRSERSRDRAAAAAYLGQMKDPASLEVLLGLTKTGDDELLGGVVEGLAVTDDPRARDGLYEMMRRSLRNGPGEPRYRSVRLLDALVCQHDERVVHLIREDLRQQPNDDARSAAARWLGQLATAESIVALREILDAMEDKGKQARAARAVASMLVARRREMKEPTLMDLADQAIRELRAMRGAEDADQPAPPPHGVETIEAAPSDKPGIPGI